MEIRGDVLQVLELRATVWTEMVYLHRLAPANFAFVGITIDASLGTVLRNLVMEVCAIVRVWVVFGLRPLRVGSAPRETAEKLWFNWIRIHGSQIQVFVLQRRFEFGDGLFERLRISQLGCVLWCESLHFKQPHFLFLSSSQRFIHASHE